MKLAVLLGCLGLAGCATLMGVVTKDDKARPWFGVRFDWQVITTANHAGNHPGLPWLTVPAACLDLPLSLGADVLTWPYMSRGTRPVLP